ncbi:helix-turn-helix domain-containing protein [Daeguia caeni]|uniref:Helix-turn-helix domain-containing protein n=1 Tax=Daeguia caeni TaxID=439612 RepID=A0ABV9H6T7_9HYPH
MQRTDAIHNKAEALDALRQLAARHGRKLSPDCDDKPTVNETRQRNIAICDALIDLLGSTFGVSSKELRSPRRCVRSIARVRQIGMYVAHTYFGMAMSEVAIGFARDRTTVMYACHLVEDLRDDVDFDAVVTAFERKVGAVFTEWRQAA